LPALFLYSFWKLNSFYFGDGLGLLRTGLTRFAGTTLTRDSGSPRQDGRSSHVDMGFFKSWRNSAGFFIQLTIVL